MSRHAGKPLLIALPLLMFFICPASAQNSPGPPVIDRTANTDRIRQQEMSSREWQLRNFGHEPNAAKDRRQVEALMAQTEEDFNRILTLHNEIARALASKKDLEYAFVSEATAEIKKRASRVQSSLALRPSPEETLELEKSPRAKGSADERRAGKAVPADQELCHQPIDREPEHD